MLIFFISRVFIQEIISFLEFGYLEIYLKMISNIYIVLVKTPFLSTFPRNMYDS